APEDDRQVVVGARAVQALELGDLLRGPAPGLLDAPELADLLLHFLGAAAEDLRDDLVRRAAQVLLQLHQLARRPRSRVHARTEDLLGHLAHAGEGTVELASDGLLLAQAVELLEPCDLRLRPA